MAILKTVRGVQVKTLTSREQNFYREWISIPGQPVNKMSSDDLNYHAHHNQNKPNFSDYLIPDGLVGRIKEDLFFCYGLMFIFSRFSNPVPIFPLDTVEAAEKVIYHLDTFFNFEINNYLQKFEEKKYNINRLIYGFDNLRKDKNFISLKKWLTKNDYEKISWLREYLLKSDKFYVINEFIHNSVNKQELEAVCYCHLFSKELLEFIYVDDPQLKPESVLNIRNTKQAWSQSKFRSKISKSTDVYIKITAKAKENLTKMADIDQISEGRLLSKLINAKFGEEYKDL